MGFVVVFVFVFFNLFCFCFNKIKRAWIKCNFLRLKDVIPQPGVVVHLTPALGGRGRGISEFKDSQAVWKEPIAKKSGMGI